MPLAPSNAWFHWTYDEERMLRADRHENGLHRRGERESALGRAIEQEHRECSCPDSGTWRQQTLAPGRHVLEKAWRGLFGRELHREEHRD